MSATKRGGTENGQKLKGIRRTATGFQVFARVNGKFKSRRFPADTTETKLIEARERLRAEELYGVPPPDGTEDGFAADARAYKALTAGMRTAADRHYRIDQWTQRFGHRLRSTITAKDIRQILEDWRLRGHHTGGPLSPASLNLRRTALMHLYTVLDGKSAKNIVRDVPPYDERYSEQVRAESMLTCAHIVRRLRPWGKMRIIAHTLLWTGWPAELLRGVNPQKDIDWTRARVRLGRRKKGKGMPPAWVPVLPIALRCLRLMAKRKLFGPFSNSSLHSAIARAVESENAWRAPRKIDPIADGFNPYALRHSFATWAASRIKDDRALKELLRTNSIRRYTEGAVAERLESARAALVKGPKTL
jgi:integrase